MMLALPWKVAPAGRIFEKTWKSRLAAHRSKEGRFKKHLTRNPAIPIMKTYLY
jgi:hypothetical protein